MRLRNIGHPFGEELNVYADVVVEGPLIFNVKLEYYLRDHLINFCISWGVKDATSHVDDEYDFALVYHAVVHPGLSESYFLYPFGEAMVPHLRFFPLSI